MYLTQKHQKTTQKYRTIKDTLYLVRIPTYSGDLNRW